MWSGKNERDNLSLKSEATAAAPDGEGYNPRLRELYGVDGLIVVS